MTQTAVEWLYLQMKKYCDDSNVPNDLLQQAKEMEKEDHKKTYYQGLNSNFQDFEQYYNETYGKNINDNTNL